jgi:hypothetical protein
MRTNLIRLMARAAAISVLALVLAVSVVRAQQEGPRSGRARATAPTGAEIEAAVTGAEFEMGQICRLANVDLQNNRCIDRTVAVEESVTVATVALRPLARRKKLTLRELEAGQVIGVLETTVAGPETGLPAGRYHLYLAKVGERWRLYAEAGGEIVREASRISLQEAAEAPSAPTLLDRGLGWLVGLEGTEDEPYIGRRPRGGRQPVTSTRRLSLEFYF